MAAILSVTEQPEGWSGNRTEKGDYEFNRVFYVLTQTMNVGPFGVLSAVDPVTGMAVPGDFDDYHAGDDALGFAFVKSKTARRDRVQPRLWIVEVRYSTAKDTQERQIAENPLDRPAVYSWDSVTYQKVVAKDKDDQAVVNSAGERFSPLPTMDDNRPVLRVERNEATFNESRAIDYQDAVNTDMFRGFDPGQAKVAKITGTTAYENSVFYWQVTYEIHFRREGWRLEILDEGTYTTTALGVKLLFFDVRGQIMQSGLLDGHGNELADGSDPVFLPFDVYKKRPFNVLGL